MEIYYCEKHDFSSTAHGYCPFCEIARLQAEANWNMKEPCEARTEIERLKEENDSLKLGVSSLGVIVHQLRGALGYAVPDHTPANPEILNRIADALNKEIAALQARIKELEDNLNCKAHMKGEQP